MTAHSKLILVLSLVALVPACSDPVSPADTGSGLDAPIAPGTDAPIAPGTDAPIAPGTDAPIAPGTDAPMPLDAPLGSDTGTMASGDPSLPGPFTVAAPVESNVSAGGRTTPVAAYVPSGSARHPLVIFLPGFQLTASQYEGTIERIASHGFVVVGADPSASLFSANHVNMAADAVAVLDWALGATSGLAGRIDSAHIAIMGHSLGGKLSTMVASSDARITALLALDPVNGGAGPAGYSAAAPDIVPERVTPLTIPVGFIGETNNATGGSFGMSCAPAAQNYTTFYDAATMSTWAAEWTLAGADHMDFLDNPACGFTCSVCTDGPGDDAAQLGIARTLSVAFLRRHLASDASMNAWLTGASVPSGATTRHRP